MKEATTDSDNYTLADFLGSGNPDPFDKAKAFGLFLADWKNKGTYSYHRTVTSACSSTTTIRDAVTKEDHRMVVLSSNNYLGLNTRPELIYAAIEAIKKYGTGTCGSRFLSGTYDLIEELEHELAIFEQHESAMVFTSGYQANVGTISALMRPGDIILIDRLDHASIVDGCRMTRCTFCAFKHNDMDHLERLLKMAGKKHHGKLIVVDGVFSMDGDTANLPGIIELAKRYGAKTMVDEAHGTGVLGPNGQGTVGHFGLHNDVDIILGTFSKAIAATGGFIAASKDVIDYVRHYGRSYMFSASPTPSAVATALTAIRIIQKEPELRERLWDNINYLHSCLKQLGFEVFPDPPESAIITILIGKDVTVRNMSKSVYEAGIFASTVAYPAVPRDEGKLRLSISASHSREQLNQVLEALSHIGKQHGII